MKSNTNTNSPRSSMIASECLAKPKHPISVKRMENQVMHGFSEVSYPIFVKDGIQGAASPHEHIFYEIVLVVGGTASHLTAAGTQRLHAGDIIIIKPRIWHGYADTKKFHIINCLFDQKVLKHHRTFLSLIRGSFELFRKPPLHPPSTPPTVVHATPYQRDRIAGTLNAMMTERLEQRLDWEAATIVHLLDVIVSISRLNWDSAHDASIKVPAKIRDFVSDITEFLEGRFQEPFCRNALAKQFHVSPSYLSRIFSKKMGMGLVDYIHHLRIEESCRLLRSTDWAISRIASEVGYDEVTYFSRRFRKSTGRTALNYRKSQGLNSSGTNL